uniref:SLAM family member 7-like n=1 Tax=Cyprinus carpio TaxID=7962 RepID=A0A8C1ZQ16_CYPCA
MCHLYNNNKKMSLRCLMLVIICVVFITTEAVSGEDVNVFGEVGGTVSFRPARIDPSVSSIIWKHRSSTGSVVKAIEWDADDGVTIPNPRFKGITTLDKKTGEITITKLNFEHSGLYTIDINSKEQEQRFTLEVLAPVPKPEIEMNPNESTNSVSPAFKFCAPTLSIYLHICSFYIFLLFFISYF